MLGDTDVLSNLRVLQTELTGAGILEPLLCAEGTTDVLVTAPDSVWVDDGSRPAPHRRPLRRRSRGAHGWRSGWRCRRAAASTRRSPGSTAS